MIRTDSDKIPKSNSFPEEELRAGLHRIFGFSHFRPNQQEIVNAVLTGRDVFAVMPTGGGKSLCYQLPAHLMPGTCMVISPLIALMKDQVDAADRMGLRAATLNSAQLERERLDVFRRLQAGELDLLYVSPERLAMEGFLNNMKRLPFSFIAVDEAHCISEWGHDFRPDYLSLSELVNHFPHLPIAAFTATATSRVQNDIAVRLGLRNPFTVRASFDRPNLFYEVQAKGDVNSQILAFIQDRPGEAGIVYRTTRDAVEKTADILSANGIKALPYHAGLDDSIRHANQEAFQREQADVVVATVAFGMGIDKSNVRYVVHGDLPKNMESYYQETGRAGRDGEPSHCVLFFGRGDIPKIRYFIDQVENPEERQRLLFSLKTISAYSQSNACRRKQILVHFGETYPTEKCGCCDFCTSARETVDKTEDAQKILSAIIRAGERFGAGHIADIIRGADTQKIRAFHHQELKTYGAGKDQPQKYWLGLIDDLATQGIVQQTDGKYPILVCAPKAKDVLSGNLRINVLHKNAGSRAERHRTRGGSSGGSELFDQLRGLRRKLAQTENVPPYIVFSDRTLHEMADRLPSSPRELLAISGVGETKLKRYGKEFLESISQFIELHPEAKGLANKQAGHRGNLPQRAPMRTPPQVGKTAEETFQYVSQGMGLEEIAAQRELSVQTIRSHLEILIRVGRNIDIDAFVPAEKRGAIAALFQEMGNASLKAVMDASNGSYTYDELGLVRAWLDRPGGEDSAG